MGRLLSQTPDAVRQRERKRLDGFALDSPDLARPERPCARCSTMFQPTTRRRMMCAACYRQASGAYVENGESYNHDDPRR